jgi:hypothetical protein
VIGKIDNYQDPKIGKYIKRARLRRSTRKPISYVKLAQSLCPEQYLHDEEMSNMTYSELLTASHALSIAQNERAINWDSFSPKVSAFVKKSMMSDSVDKDLAALNRQIVLRIDEQD